MRRLLVAVVAVAAGAAVTATMLLAGGPSVPSAPVPVTGVEAGVVPLAVPPAAAAAPAPAPGTAPDAVPDAPPDAVPLAAPLAAPVVSAGLTATTTVAVSTPVDTVPAPAAATVAAVATAGEDAGPPRLTVPALGILAPVVDITTGPDGVLHPPTDVRQVGWLSSSARPGADEGTTVLVGHLDSRTKGKGALYSLGASRPGDRITVNGVEYTTAAIRNYPKQALPQDLWATGGQPRLVIITCGGRFDTATRSYEQNTVVYALPA